jgi:hypothetical protein
MRLRATAALIINAPANRPGSQVSAAAVPFPAPGAVPASAFAVVCRYTPVPIA